MQPLSLIEFKHFQPIKLILQLFMKNVRKAAIPEKASVQLIGVYQTISLTAEVLLLAPLLSGSTLIYSGESLRLILHVFTRISYLQ